MILISACLLGVNCKYNGKNNFNKELNDILEDINIKNKLKAICPEVAGGLSTPRAPSEIINGDGQNILNKNNKALVINNNGVDVTEYFVRGVKNVWYEIEEKNIDFAILKSRSPSCGSSQIYSGDFSGTLKKGEGVMSAFLRQHGIEVYSEKEIDKIRKKVLT